MDRSVMQLRQQVGEKLGRCVDEVKLIAFDRQLEAVGWYQTILVTIVPLETRLTFNSS